MPGSNPFYRSASAAVRFEDALQEQGGTDRTVPERVTGATMRIALNTCETGA